MDTDDEIQQVLDRRAALEAAGALDAATDGGGGSTSVATTSERTPLLQANSRPTRARNTPHRPSVEERRQRRRGRHDTFARSGLNIF